MGNVDDITKFEKFISRSYPKAHREYQSSFFQIDGVKRFLTDRQQVVAEFEQLIENCSGNLTFGTMGYYKSKLEDAKYWSCSRDIP